MRVVVVYRQESDHAREVIDYLRDFQRRTGRELDEINPDTRDGVAFCETYGVVEYPSILALDDSGRVLNVWRGSPLPTINEVSYYG